MPVVFIVLGIFLLIIAARGQAGEMVDILGDDLTGKPNFFGWLIALAMLGAVNTFAPKEFKGVTNAFSILILVVLLLSQPGFFAKLGAALKPQ